MQTFLKEDDIWALSFTITGRCNCNCSYCHFYAKRGKENTQIDMPEELFENYLSLIKYIQKNYHSNLQVRFSGGEPLMLGDKLFDYSTRIYEETGIKPFVLSNGRLINKSVIEKSLKSHISAYLLSIENPLDVSEGAPKTEEVLNKIALFNCKDVQILPAIMIIKNEYFKDIVKIADYIYDKIGMLPAFAELTYQAFESPTEQQLLDLYSNVKELAKKYYSKVPIRIFPYVSPELYAQGHDNYLSELDLENTIGITQNNIPLAAENLFAKLNKSYRPNPCTEKSCEWYDDCRIIKWLWLEKFPGSNIEGKQKLLDFCKMKKTINSALYEGILSNKANGSI